MAGRIWIKRRMPVTVTLNLPPETVRLLQEKAALVGQTLEGYLQGLAEREAGIGNGTALGREPLTAEQWFAQWRAWANADRHLSAGIVLDVSRESIYAGRGE